MLILHVTFGYEPKSIDFRTGNIFRTQSTKFPFQNGLAVLARLCPKSYSINRVPDVSDQNVITAFLNNNYAKLKFMTGFAIY